MRHTRLPALILAAALVACDDEAGPNISGVNPISIARIEIEPALDTAYVGDTVEVADLRPYEAVAIGRTGAPLDVRLAWLTRDPAVATVDEDGLVRVRGLGTARIVASAGKQGEALLVVLQQVASVAVLPASPTGARGTQLRLSGAATGPDGAPVRGVAWTWSSSNTAVATVDATGLARLLAPGTTTITMTGGGQTAQVQLVVT